ncbi:MAG: hypothetical protein M5R36_24290 [Deltaproteobacteria bacterium]|nr:hypothetical protein [Deltaproteobacteria bacterium]
MMETAALGWNVYRTDSSGRDTIKLNGDLIAPGRAAYDFIDREPLAADTDYRYTVEFVSAGDIRRNQLFHVQLTTTTGDDDDAGGDDDSLGNGDDGDDYYGGPGGSDEAPETGGGDGGGGGGCGC